MNATAEAIEVFKPIRELASRLAVCSRAYADIVVSLDEPEKRKECQKDALGLSLSIAPVMILALENIQSYKRKIDKPYQPPIASIMVLGAIASSCHLIAAANANQNMDEVPLLDLVTLQSILEAPVVKNWMYTCLGAGQ